MTNNKTTKKKGNKRSISNSSSNVRQRDKRALDTDLRFTKKMGDRLLLLLSLPLLLVQCCYIIPPNRTGNNGRRHLIKDNNGNTHYYTTNYTTFQSRSLGLPTWSLHKRAKRVPSTVPGDCGDREGDVDTSLLTEGRWKLEKLLNSSWRFLSFFRHPTVALRLCLQVLSS